MFKNQKGIAHLLLVVVAAVALTGVGFVVWRAFDKRTVETAQFSEQDGQRSISQSEAIKAGQALSGGQCQGEGPDTLTHSPMDPPDFSHVIPYGLMIDDHVTPIDHQYFAPADYRSKPDSYEVYAMADGVITEISRRDRSGSPSGVKEEFRFVFAQTCTFLYYYDLVTSLAPDVKQAYEANQRDGYAGRLGFKVKAGQLVGYIGAQTLDFAVWDTTKPLSGFINPKSYEAERWKIYTADPLNYYSAKLKEFILSRYQRTAQPISGKIDYDQPGKLIGNWFLEGSNGYGGQRGTQGSRYASTHLAIAPEHLDPRYFVISIGDYQGKSQQFVTRANKPNPAEVTVASGRVKYELVEINYLKPDGSFWDRLTPVRGVKVDNSGFVQGTVLAQLIDGGNQLKFEVFAGKTPGEVKDFTPAAKIYTR